MKIEFRYRFEAAHRFLQSSSKACMTPHGHTWYATLGVLFTGSSLSSSQMTVEFSQIKRHWKSLIQETFDHSYMHNFNDPIIEVLKAEGSEPRLIPFPGDPTTELIALFMFNKMDLTLKDSSFKDRVEVQNITLQETPTNTLTCDRAFFTKEFPNFSTFSGWWTNTQTDDRSFRVEN